MPFFISHAVTLSLQWYTSVRKTLEDPAYADWYVKFKPQGPWYSSKCDNNYSPPLCTDLYHNQVRRAVCPSGREGARRSHARRFTAFLHSCARGTAGAKPWLPARRRRLPGAKLQLRKCALRFLLLVC